MMTKDIENVLMRGSIADLRTLYLEKKLSVTDAVNWYLNRINDISQNGPAINAVREVSLRAVDDAKRADEAIAKGAKAATDQFLAETQIEELMHKNEYQSYLTQAQQLNLEFEAKGCKVKP